MNAGRIAALGVVLALAAGCSRDRPEPAAPADDTPRAERPVTPTALRQIEPGLTMRILRHGDGATAKPGQTAVVHYTGWLFDPEAPDHRGEKFDSSHDRGEHFRFALGAGSVIRGWDRGVAGMQVGEVRELTIAPELAYGDRGAGEVIPAGATLVFEVELAALEGDAAGN